MGSLRTFKWRLAFCVTLKVCFWTYIRHVSGKPKTETSAITLEHLKQEETKMTGAAVPVCLLFLLSLCSACYISNCPIGGKRSIMDAPLRKCMSCGPGDRGRCFGPSICCGEGLGCLLGSPESARCMEENYLLTPCLAGGRPCGSEGGHCATSGLCCDAESCTTDQSCLAEEDADDQTGQFEGSDPTDVILRLLHLASHTSHRIHQ